MSPAPTPSDPLGRRLNVGLFVATIIALGAAFLLTPSDDAAIAEDEQRRLAPAPELRWDAIVDGSFAEAAEAFVADHFPARERFLAAHFWLAEHRGFRDERVAFYDLEVAEDADLVALDDAPAGDTEAAWAGDYGGLAPLADTDDAALLGELDAPLGDPDDLGLESDTDSDTDTDTGGPGLRERPRRRGGILVVDGRAMQLFTGGPAGARGYARALNDYVDAVGDGVTVYSLIVPTAQTFYLPAEYAHHAKPEVPNIAATYALMSPEIKKIDVVSALAPHRGESIYFRTDHHWTGLGAYYAYTAFCAAAGIEPTPLAAMEARQRADYRGSLYRFTRDSQLGRAADVVDYWLPPTPVSVVRYSPEMIRVAVKGPLIRERGAGYGVFLGGDFPLTIARTETNPGRRALLIKNSYGNPFAVFLASHYEELLIVDYRYFKGSVLDLIRTHEVDDLIILNGTITANARFHAARIGWVMDGGKRSRKARRAAAAAPAAPADP